MATAAREPRLNRSTLNKATAVQITRYALWTGVLIFPAIILVALLLGVGPEMSQTLGDENSGLVYRGGPYSPGALLVGLWSFMLVGLISIRRNKDADIVIARARQLESLRMARGNKTERRAAGKVAADYAIPPDETIYSKRLRERVGCPTLIRLSAGKGTWVLQRTAAGWVYLEASGGAT